MGFIVEGKNKFDGKMYRGSIVPKRTRVFIPPFQSDYFYCRFEVSVFRKSHPLIEIGALLFPGSKCIFEINDDHAPFSDEELKSLVEYLLINENFCNVQFLEDSVKEHLLSVYKVDRHIGPRGIHLPFFRKVPVLIFIRKEEWNSGEIAKTIFWAFLEEREEKLDAPEFEDYLNREFNNSSNCDLLRHGYKIRLIENRTVGNRRLEPIGQIDAILRSNKTRQEKIEEIVDHLDSHGIVGLGEPIWPYILASVDQVHEVCNRVVTMALEAHRMPQGSLDYNMAEELWHRLIASGYAYRVAEELVNQT